MKKFEIYNDATPSIRIGTQHSMHAIMFCDLGFKLVKSNWEPDNGKFCTNSLTLAQCLASPLSWSRKEI